MTPAFNVKETPSPSVQFDSEEAVMLDPTPRVACDRQGVRTTTHSLRMNPIVYCQNTSSVLIWRGEGVHRGYYSIAMSFLRDNPLSG